VASGWLKKKQRKITPNFGSGSALGSALELQKIQELQKALLRLAQGREKQG